MEVNETEALELEHESDVGAVRRRFATLAATSGLDESRTSDAALIATELATNVLKHAGGGGALLGCVAAPGGSIGVSIVAWDRGRGMNVEACLRDGMSTAGTAGAGLGAISRLATRWDAYSQHGAGTVISATVYARVKHARTAFDAAGVCVPHPGMIVCGDGWRLHESGDRATLIVCDGLGHGDGAAAATRAVLGAFSLRADDTLPGILDHADRAARATRGAAATVVRIDLAAREATVAGVGNVAAWIVGGESTRQLVTQHGTLGQAMPRTREERYAFPPGAQLVMCSDGLKSRLAIDGYPGLLAHDPATIAATLWRDHARDRDDATAVVLREAR
ncbi:MAG TPA: SpoIIE family protein phosphatase [Kofleriaceae bacterium]|nr:SpoIIE family protein phosphatase [Kofleriaceae bacterium]